MKKTVLTLMMLSLTICIFAQIPGDIKGKILDAKTKVILPGATIYVEYMGSKIAAFAEKDGRFTIKPLNPGTYNVYVTFVGYDTTLYKNISVYADKTTFLDTTYLTEKGIGLNTVIIRGSKPIETSPVTTIPGNLFCKTPNPGNMNLTLQTFNSDIKVSDNGKEIYFRGSRNGDAVYYVDGVKLMNNNLNIPSNSIGSVTVYTGAVPANYGDFTGGVVVIETKSYSSWLNEQQSK